MQEKNVEKPFGPDFTSCRWIAKIFKNDLDPRDGMGREVAGEFRMGNMCTPVADTCWCMVKPKQYCKVKKNNKKK